MLHWKRRLTWNISKNMTYTPFFFRRNRDLGTISVYVGYRDARCLPPICMYMVSKHIVSANNSSAWQQPVGPCCPAASSCGRSHSARIFFSFSPFFFVFGLFFAHPLFSFFF